MTLQLCPTVQARLPRCAFPAGPAGPTGVMRHSDTRGAESSRRDSVCTFERGRPRLQ